MKKLFILCMFLTFCLSCAKRIENQENNNAARQFASSDNIESLTIRPNEQKSLHFDQEANVKIPKFFKLNSSLNANHHEARIYFDYSSLSSSYAYFCRYISKNKNLIFENCYYHSDLGEDNLASYYLGYEETISKNKKIVVEFLSTQNGAQLEATVDFEFYLEN